MPLEIIRNDITKVKAGAIVNSANPFSRVGKGVDSAIYKAAGKRLLLRERTGIGNIAPGDASYTKAYALDARYIIHTVGPVWEGGNNKEEEILRSCYRNSLKKSVELNCESVAFPLISTGTYGFPKDLALRSAIDEISSFLMEHELLVYLVVYDPTSFELSEKLFKDIASFISDSDVSIYASQALDYNSYRANHLFRRKQAQSRYESMEMMSISADASSYEPSSDSIEEILKRKEDTFQQYLFRLIDKKNLNDTDVYKKANIDRKHFSKIRSDINYNPKKKTVLALAIGMGLNVDETKDLLLRAGFALSPNNTTDKIIEYCLENNIKDINEINIILFRFEQQTLGV